MLREMIFKKIVCVGGSGYKNDIFLKSNPQTSGAVKFVEKGRTLQQYSYEREVKDVIVLVLVYPLGGTRNVFEQFSLCPPLSTCISCVRFSPALKYCHLAFMYHRRVSCADSSYSRRLLTLIFAWSSRTRMRTYYYH